LSIITEANMYWTMDIHLLKAQAEQQAALPLEAPGLPR
jgi:hypothetical protein